MNLTPFWKLMLIFTVLSLALTACAASTSSGDGTVSSDQPPPIDSTPLPPGDLQEKALVENIELLTLESFPVQIKAVVSGNLPDGCTSIAKSESIRDGNTFIIHLYTSRPADAVCTMALVPFKESVSLDVYGLLAGEYTVQAYEIKETFRLEMDNILK